MENALNELIEAKITQYQLSGEPNPNSFKIGDSVEFDFVPNPSVTLGGSEEVQKQIVDLFARTDLEVDKCSKVVGQWQPKNKFSALYQHLDELNDQIEQLDTPTMDAIGQKAKELNQTLDYTFKKLN